ncbi:MAG: hypothetical protein JO143_04390 [Acetobacteraceae bacterium]|nr:hypothetical protein [Acetobacteraceae bacterium]
MDGALHDAFAVATHNQAVIALARVRLLAEWGELKARSMTPERKAVLGGEHRAVVDAIRRREGRHPCAAAGAHSACAVVYVWRVGGIAAGARLPIARRVRWRRSARSHASPGHASFGNASVGSPHG